ncbi:MAG: imidazolonepropionase [Alphaproteobacteria bacterium]|nr:imidazolonepropionase [Alphaproteobacteria bacterium]MBV9064067.1 imidazolonepropionase [Alphaproteobacteria bacterium]
MRVWHNARLLTPQPTDRGVVAAERERIVYAGPAADAPQFSTAERIDCGGRWITPGLIDCHTHLVYAGNRAHEFELRLNGAGYEEIARSGGGILSTVKATRAASLEELVDQSRPRRDALIAEGVTTLEIKSGYGLTLEDEIKMLRAARALGDKVNVSTTFLGAHTCPPETDIEAYTDHVCDMISSIEPMADAVDVFCERIAFTPEQTARIFVEAQRHGLKVKLHADQLSNGGGAALAARHRAVSADHLEYTDEAGVMAMADAGTIGVLLPGAFYFLRETKLPPIDLLRKHRVPIAIATDCNPGTSPLTSILLCMNMAATCFRLTVEECLLGVTRNAARALGRDDIGVLEAGKRCDLAIWDIEDPAELVYRIGFNPLRQRVFGGMDA